MSHTTRSYWYTRQLATITRAVEKPTYPSLTKSKWRLLWKARILPSARTICFDNALCSLGDLKIGAAPSLLYYCKSKWIAWQQVLQDCTLGPVMQDVISNAIFSLTTIPTW
ncbi:hypothetical protein BDC45DRAFT_565119 [Circinella umbellata]|nr:hypothetical protein BDC45DRAFT_565119 [Circinella umbellata]